MSKKNNRDALMKCRKGAEFLNFAARAGAEVISGKGSHSKVVNENGMVIVPSHPRDLATGTRDAIIKTFIRMGLVAGLVAFFLCAIL